MKVGTYRLRQRFIYSMIEEYKNLLYYYIIVVYFELNGWHINGNKASSLFRK